MNQEVERISKDKVRAALKWMTFWKAVGSDDKPVVVRQKAETFCCLK